MGMNTLMNKKTRNDYAMPGHQRKRDGLDSGLAQHRHVLQRRCNVVSRVAVLHGKRPRGNAQGGHVNGRSLVASLPVAIHHGCRTKQLVGCLCWVALHLVRIRIQAGRERIQSRATREEKLHRQENRLNPRRRCKSSPTATQPAYENSVPRHSGLDITETRRFRGAETSAMNGAVTATAHSFHHENIGHGVSPNVGVHVPVFLLEHSP